MKDKIFFWLLLILLGVFLAPNPTSAQGIFGGDRSGSGIFGDLPNRFRHIFEGRDIDIGGSIIPYTPDPPPPADPNDPPQPDAGQFLKARVEWDTMWRGTQPPALDPTDPIEDLHTEYIIQHGCCADCGEQTIVDACETCAEYGEACDVCNDSSTPKGPAHALWGWCGETATVDENLIPTLDGVVTSVQLDSPGPNDNILPNAIPNKMIRRDGYTFQCLKVACTPIIEPTPTIVGPTPEIPLPTPTPYYLPASTYNYIEFQTLVYHSNDFIMELYVENVGNQPVENFQVHRTTREDYSWAHNVDIGQGSGINTVFGPIVPPYKHGSSFEAVNESGASLEPGEQTLFVQYPDQGLRNSIPTGATGLGPGALVPRDYNFVCDSDDGSESERCGQKILLIPIPADHSCNGDSRRCFDHFRDVSALGGCGYNASSNNSIIGPIDYEIRYGDDLSSRSVVRVSIPVGNPIDDEARPFGWPTTGRIAENWGNTGQAQESGEADIRQIDDGLRSEYDEYLFCPGQGQTYPNDGRARAGDYLHPGIDIAPAVTRIRPPMVYTTHAGWVTFAGQDPVYPDKGYTVQVESDFNRDMIPDALTRYTHLMPGSIQFDVVDKQNPMHADGTRYAFGTSHYVARNTLLGMMGDSGSEGNIHTQYEVVYVNPDDPQLPVFTPSNPPVLGEIGQERCSDDPYIPSCLVDSLVNGQFFSQLRFEPQMIFGPVYVNP